MFTYVFVTLSILQSQFSEIGFKKAENFEQNVVLLLFLFTLDKLMSCEIKKKQKKTWQTIYLEDMLYENWKKHELPCYR